MVAGVLNAHLPFYLYIIRSLLDHLNRYYAALICSMRYAGETALRPVDDTEVSLTQVLLNSYLVPVDSLNHWQSFNSNDGLRLLRNFSRLAKVLL